MAAEFDKLLEEYRKLAVQVGDEESYLDWLKDELKDAKRKLDEFVDGRPGNSQLQFSLATGAIVRHDPSVPALQETARAVAELGDGVTAEQLASRLDITRDAARLRLQRAARKGLIARMGTGRYRAIKRAPTENATAVVYDPGQVHMSINGKVVQE